jgi:acyl carrier protein
MEESRLHELELTTEVDSLGVVELITALEEAFGVTFREWL